jgi:hypothetical protein
MTSLRHPVAGGLSMDEWLDEDHLAYFVIDTVKLIDTTAFHEIHPEGPGRPA